MKLSKRIIGLQTHQFAPELNTLVIQGDGSLVELRVPGCTSIKDAKKKLFPVRVAFRQATVEKTYPGDKAWLNRSYTGAVGSFLELKKFIADLKATMLDDGSGSIRVRTKLIG